MDKRCIRYEDAQHTLGFGSPCDATRVGEITSDGSERVVYEVRDGSDQLPVCLQRRGRLVVMVGN